VRHFDSLGLKNYIVEMGGEIFARGMSARDDRWIVGIDSPKEGNITPGADLQVRIRLSGRGLATSGNYRKFYEDPAGRKIVHTIDPKTGQPVISRILSATVIAPDAATADMYGTYFMVAGVEKTAEFLNRHPEVDAYVIYTDPGSDAPQIMATPGIEIVESKE
jgi:thiamine biosynthesis lipoprotein